MIPSQSSAINSQLNRVTIRALRWLVLAFIRLLIPGLSQSVSSRHSTPFARLPILYYYYDDGKMMDIDAEEATANSILGTHETIVIHCSAAPTTQLEVPVLLLCTLCVFFSINYINPSHHLNWWGRCHLVLCSIWSVAFESSSSSSSCCCCSAMLIHYVRISEL